MILAERLSVVHELRGSIIREQQQFEAAPRAAAVAHGSAAAGAGDAGRRQQRIQRDQHGQEFHAGGRFAASPGPMDQDFERSHRALPVEPVLFRR